MLTRFLVGLESSCKDWKHVIAGALDVEVGRLESSCKDWKHNFTVDEATYISAGIRIFL